MRFTTDTYTGKRFGWNTTVLYDDDIHGRIAVPARESRDGLTWLHPDRVPFPLLAELNADRVKVKT